MTANTLKTGRRASSNNPHAFSPAAHGLATGSARQLAREALRQRAIASHGKLQKSTAQLAGWRTGSLPGQVPITDEMYSFMGSPHVQRINPHTLSLKGQAGQVLLLAFKDTSYAGQFACSQLARDLSELWAGDVLVHDATQIGQLRVFHDPCKLLERIEQGLVSPMPIIRMGARHWQAAALATDYSGSALVIGNRQTMLAAQADFAEIFG